MIRHQNPGGDGPAEATHGLAEEVHEGEAIVVAAEDVAPLIAARGDVMQSVRVFDSKRSCHSAAEDPSVCGVRPETSTAVEKRSSDWKLRPFRATARGTLLGKRRKKVWPHSSGRSSLKFSSGGHVRGSSSSWGQAFVLRSSKVLKKNEGLTPFT